MSLWLLLYCIPLFQLNNSFFPAATCHYYYKKYWYWLRKYLNYFFNVICLFLLLKYAKRQCKQFNLSCSYGLFANTIIWIRMWTVFYVLCHQLNLLINVNICWWLLDFRVQIGFCCSTYNRTKSNTCDVNQYMLLVITWLTNYSVLYTSFLFDTNYECAFKLK